MKKATIIALALIGASSLIAQVDSNVYEFDVSLKITLRVNDKKELEYFVEQTNSDTVRVPQQLDSTVIAPPPTIERTTPRAIQDLWLINVPAYRTDQYVLQKLARLPDGVRTYDHAYKHNYRLPMPTTTVGSWEGVDMDQAFKFAQLFKALNASKKGMEVIAFEDLPWLRGGYPRELQERLERNTKYPNKFLPTDEIEVMQAYGLAETEDIPSFLAKRAMEYNIAGVGKEYQLNEIWGERYPGAEQKKYLNAWFEAAKASGLRTVAPPMHFVDRDQRIEKTSLDYGPVALEGINYDLYCANVYSTIGLNNGNAPWIPGGAIEQLNAAIAYAQERNAELFIGEACVNSYQSSVLLQAKYELVLALHSWANDVTYGHYGDIDGASLGAPLFDGCGLLDELGNTKPVYDAFVHLFDVAGDCYVSSNDATVNDQGVVTELIYFLSDHLGEAYAVHISTDAKSDEIMKLSYLRENQ